MGSNPFLVILFDIYASEFDSSTCGVAGSVDCGHTKVSMSISSEVQISSSLLSNRNVFTCHLNCFCRVSTVLNTEPKEVCLKLFSF